MNFKSIVTIASCSTILLTGCSKKMNQFSADYFTVNPNPLEVVGDRVPATVTANIPAKFFVKNAEVTVTPYLVFDGQEVASQAYSFQGEKVRGNAPVISYDNGQSVTIPVMYNYQPEMIQSQLALAFEVRQGNKQYALPRVIVANGVIATAAFADAGTVNPAIAPDNFQRIINEKYAADILFLINRANIRNDQLKTAEIIDLNNEIINANNANNRQIKELNISSYASPDGTWAFNSKLAQDRENTTKKYLNDQLKKDNITEFGELTANFTPEDWEGFQQLVAKSNIQDKDLILSILSMYKDPEQREKEIRNLSSVFDQLAETILPQLRFSRITASIDVIGKSDQEIMELFQTNPSALSVDEILYAATLTDNNAQKIKIYETAARQYPNDYRTFNDLGVAQFIAGDYNAAQANFAQAARIAPSEAQPQLNLGLVSLVKKDYRDANQKFGNASNLTEVNDALGTLYLMQGDVNAANQAFGNSKSNNAALAQILAKNYTQAKTTLAGVANPNATTYYLTAVLGARTNNESMVKDNLQKAVKLNPALSAKAAKDLEFANFNISNIAY
ncbi:MAG: hypothetical protein K2M25_02330 [Muribaculaceae bacterium]|nr:hypothetical protein [Muribaculaceae bacterium]MDE6224957.1 hypothetical protein [Muribaculaceae bacterium]